MSDKGMSAGAIARANVAEYLAIARQWLDGQARPQDDGALFDKREARRSEADFILEYRLAGRDNGGIGRALDHSETGVRFVTNQPLAQGSYVTVRVLLRSGRIPVLTCLANVVRCLNLPNGTGYAVGCAYD